MNWLRQALWLPMLAVCAALPACKREPPAAPDPVPAASDQTKAEVAVHPGSWLLQGLEVELELADGQDIDGLSTEGLQRDIGALLVQDGVVRAVGPAPADAPLAEQARATVTLAFVRLTAAGEPVPLAAAPTDSQLRVVAVAQAEQRPAEGKKDGQLAERRLLLTLPMPAQAVAQPQRFLATRLAKVGQQAIADALGQLWAHGLPDSDLIPLLADREVWRVTAAIRELGERKLVAELARLHKLTTDSRKDVAVVALAAVGRLAQAGSVQVVRAALDQPASGEQLDAALVALADLQQGPEGAAATAALRQLATESPWPLVQMRAKQLLEAR
jgi:hypothetical protein